MRVIDSCTAATPEQHRRVAYDIRTMRKTGAGRFGAGTGQLELRLRAPKGKTITTTLRLFVFRVLYH
jgi:hypothetical protein